MSVPIPLPRYSSFICIRLKDIVLLFLVPRMNPIISLSPYTSISNGPISGNCVLSKTYKS